jgi:hypothetical protein
VPESGELIIETGMKRHRRYWKVLSTQHTLGHRWRPQDVLTESNTGEKLFEYTMPTTQRVL